MPGISFVQGQTTGKGAEEASLRTVCFREDYERTVHAADGTSFLGSTGYAEYPVKTVETADAIYLLEGHLYDVNDEERHLRSIGSKLLDERLEEVRAWLSDRDGDFLLLAYERDTGALSVVNDAFARLPVYHATVGENVVLSRELKFVRSLARHYGDSLEPDVTAFAQTLLFGYQLGTRTLFDSVEPVPPGSYVRIDGDVRVESLYRHDFEGTPRGDRSVRENARELASRFETACANRDTGDLPNVVSLSGGLDSRAVAGGYEAIGADYATATFEKPNEANTADVRLAESIADALDAEWERYAVERTEGHRTDLLEMKQGLNFLAMSFLLDFLEQIEARHGKFTYVTGDGGDKALPDLTPPREFDSRRDLAEFVVDAHSIFDPEEVTTLTGVSRERLVQSVEVRLESYPERTYDAKYVHFLVRERGINWLNHGEDRNRYYCWSVSPFYSLPFFEYAMNVPADQKRRSRLQAAFLEELDPALCDIENANYDAPVSSLRHKAKTLALDLVSRYPSLRDTVASLLRDGASDGLTDVLATEVRRAGETPFDDAALGTVVRNGEEYAGRELYNLLTLVATADYEPERPLRTDPTAVIADGSGYDDE
ncbi:asparagine synthase-related protein [Halorussus limi]|uniref:Asparagine synthase-related protein n=1 Tax=Halorussus limi TaxID=2938695 RepID=A0A8U0HSR3_9EURY|nr:asparagine synthase-related protein [Halorussus limi]UPV73803.1 asparagine synthase-related protein [Halorussus limi]